MYNSANADNFQATISLIADDPVLQEKLERYKLLFTKYHPTKPYNVKREYGGSFFQVNFKNGNPIPLYKARLQDCLEQHLQPDVWHAYKVAYNGGHTFDKRKEYFWLAMTAPKKTNYHVFDLDNKDHGRQGKNVIGNYVEPRRPLLNRPVTFITLPYMQTIQKIYNNFPNRIWCISSETLGLHAWHFMKKEDWTQKVLDHYKKELLPLNIPHVESHPNFARCFRRPFGEDYRVLFDGYTAYEAQDWTMQLEYFQMGLSCSLVTIAAALVEHVERQWKIQKQRNNAADSVTAPYRHHIEQVKDWIDKGCPELNIAPEIAFSNKSANPVGFDYSILRDGNWVHTLEELAKEGLPHTGSVAPVCMELATWLLWVELYDKKDKLEIAKDALWQFVTNKHNGTISRMATNPDEVKSQVERCVKLSAELQKNDKVKSMALFERLRDKRLCGLYKKNIFLLPLLLAKNTNEGEMEAIPPPMTCGQENSIASLERQAEEKTTSSSISPPYTYYSVPCWELPEPVLAAIKKHARKSQVYPFATKLLNLLYKLGGTANVSQEKMFEILGYRKQEQVVKYKKILIAAKVLYDGNYVRGKCSKRYRLTDFSQRELDLARNPSILPQESLPKQKATEDPPAIDLDFNSEINASLGLELDAILSGVFEQEKVTY